MGLDERMPTRLGTGVWPLEVVWVAGLLPGTGVTFGSEPPLGTGSECGTDREEGGDDGEPHLRWWPFPFNAWTSISCPPEQGAVLCGWLFPGPCRMAFGAAPFLFAIWPAVLPFPYSFV